MGMNCNYGTLTLIRSACFLFFITISICCAGSEAGFPTAPSIIARDIKNKLVSSDSLRQKGPVIVDFWATWCKPCMAEFKALTKLVKKYRQHNLTVIAVSQDGPAEAAKVKQLAAAKKWPFIVMMDNGKKIAAQFQVRATPETFLIGTDGTIHAAHRGYIPGDEVKLEEEIRDLLAPK